MPHSSRISLVAWADREPRFCFVLVPNERGRYVRTDMSVIRAECPRCRALVGEPCFRRTHGGTRVYRAGTHYVRREAADLRQGSRQHLREVKPRMRLCACGGADLKAEGA